MLDAGRGNPNWVATTPRAAFFLLGRVRARGVPPRVGRARPRRHAGTRRALRTGSTAFLAERGDADGAATPRRARRRTASRSDSTRDDFVYELTDGIIGDHYPGPDRICVHVERSCASTSPTSCCEGDTARRALGPLRDRGRHRGDLLHLRLARQQLAAPTGRPGRADGSRRSRRTSRSRGSIATGSTSSRSTRARSTQNDDPTWQFPDAEIDKLADPAIKALFVVNPSNPPSVMLAPDDARAHRRDRRGHTIPNLIVVTDDVYGTFVPEFRVAHGRRPGEHDRDLFVLEVLRRDGLAARRRRARTENNVLDGLIASLPSDDLAELDRRYESISHRDRRHPVHRPHGRRQPPGRAQPHRGAVAAAAGADDALRRRSRCSTTDQSYKNRDPRASSTAGSPSSTRAWGSSCPADPLRAGYYAEIDLMRWARRRYGADFAAWLADELRARRSGVPPRRRARRGPAARRRVRRPGVVGPGVARQPRRRLLPRGRRRDRARVFERLRRGVGGKAPDAAVGGPPRHVPYGQAAAALDRRTGSRDGYPRRGQR